MASRLAKALVAISVLNGALLAQQAIGDVSILEGLAAQRAIESFVGSSGKDLRVALDSIVARANQAPGGSADSRRNDSRNAYLATLLNARVTGRSEVVGCDPRPCRLRGVDMFISIAEPTIAGKRATVSVTILLATPRGVQYRTVNVHFERDRDRWNATRVEELGIS